MNIVGGRIRGAVRIVGADAAIQRVVRIGGRVAVVVGLAGQARVVVPRLRRNNVGGIGEDAVGVHVATGFDEPAEAIVFVPGLSIASVGVKNAIAARVIRPLLDLGDVVRLLREPVKRVVGVQIGRASCRE